MSPDFVSYTDSASGIRFVFKKEAGHPEMLHIYARHVMEPEDAIETYFAGRTIWNARRERYETTSETHTLYWYWLEERRVVMVVTCFREDDR
jgi:hypothetical protein